jgi:hypothetical protein
MGKRFGTCNIRSLYRSGSLIRATRELPRSQLDLMDYRKLGATNGARQEKEIVFFIKNGRKIIN